MKLGQLNSPELDLYPEITYTRIGGRIPFDATLNEEQALCWKWETHHATGIELHCRFPQRIYLSAIALDLENAPETWSVLDANGKCVGSSAAGSSNNCVTIGAWGDYFVLRIIPTLTDLVIRALRFFGAEGNEGALYPTPNAFTLQDGALPLLHLGVMTEGEDADCRFAADFWAERLRERYGIIATEKGCLLLKKEATLAADAYTVTINEREAVIAASNRLGLLFAIERLLQLEENGSIPCCHIEDAPYKEMRGVHMYLPHASQLPFAKALIKEMLLPLHYNQIYLEFAGGMRFDTHPEISEGWLKANALAKAGEIPPFPHGSVADGELLEKAEVRDLCDFIHALGIELIPEVQSFGHVQYITYAHPEIAEVADDTEKTTTDERNADVPPSLFYKHSYCPQNKKSYEIIFDLIDEIVDVARPKRFVHMGHDEIYQLGICPKCKDVAPDKLYEMHVTALHDYLAKKGLRMMLWADMVQPVSKYRCFPCLERLPKDIVLLDFIWYFHFDKDIEENLLPFGQELMIGNLYSSHFPRYEQRIAKQGMLGGELSFWASTNEKSIAREGKFFDLCYTAEMLWSKHYCAELRSYYTDRIAALIPRLRALLRGQKAVDRRATPLTLPCEHCETLRTNAVALQAPVSIVVNAAADAIRFLHTTLYREKRLAWKSLVSIGSYTVEYADGERIEIPVTYDGNVRCFKYRYGEPLKEKYYRHEGYVCAWDADPVVLERSSDGTPITLYALDWQNPHPEKQIARILCAENVDSAAGLMLCALSVLTNKENENV